MPIKGTLTSAQRAEILEATQCSAAIRERGQWGSRMLTVSGPAGRLEEAMQMAKDKVAANGSTGGRKAGTEEEWESSRWGGGSKRRASSWRDWKEDWVTRQEYQDTVSKLLDLQARVGDLQESLRDQRRELQDCQWRLAAWEQWGYMQAAQRQGSAEMQRAEPAAKLVPRQAAEESTPTEVASPAQRTKSSEPTLEEPVATEKSKAADPGAWETQRRRSQKPRKKHGEDGRKK